MPKKPIPNGNVHARVEENLGYLGLARLRETYRDHLAQATKDSQSHLDFLDALLSDEAAGRFDRRVRRSVSRARFPVVKALETFHWNHPEKINKSQILCLFDLEFLERKRNVLFVGDTGMGKTHLAIALGVAACQKGNSVIFRTAFELVNELQAAQSDATLLKKLRALTRADLLIIDELGYLPVDKHGADMLFQVVSSRYERGSIVLTTNRAPKDWGAVFNDAMVATAILDRLSHHSDIVAIKGKSFRDPNAEAA